MLLQAALGVKAFVLCGRRDGALEPPFETLVLHIASMEEAGEAIPAPSALDAVMKDRHNRDAAAVLDILYTGRQAEPLGNAAGVLRDALITLSPGGLLKQLAPWTVVAMVG